MKRKTNKSKARLELLKDFIFILFGIFLAIILSRLGIIDWLINVLGGYVVASFIAGIFWTSAFTIAPASLTFAGITTSAPTIIVALWGSLGATFGDLLLFFFIRDRLADDLLASIKPSVVKHILSSFHFGFLKWLSPILGALIIASPLPDEFGLALLGFSKTKLSALIPIAFMMNFLGIYLLIKFSQVL